MKLAATVFVVVALSVAAVAANVTDIGGHWSKEYVEYGIDNGFINGYPDGTFQPDKAVTRAEFAKMLNSALGITKKAVISFGDVDVNQWYYPEIQKAVFAGYVSGYDNGTFLANNLITRQEAAVILSRIATRPDAVKSVDSFKDASSIASWAKGAFEFAYSKGYFSGNEQLQLTPLASLTRGQAAKILYTLRTGENIHNGDYTVTLGNAVCSETIFTDGITFAVSAANPALTFDGCVVFGDVVVKTENSASVKLDQSNLNTLRVVSEADISFNNGSSADNVSLEAPVSVSGSGITNMYVRGDAVASGITEIDTNPANLTVSGDAVIKAGSLSSLTISKKASVMLQGASVKNMEVTEEASGSVVTLASGVQVENLVVAAPASFMGAGKIKNATNKVNGVTYATKPETLNGQSSGGTVTPPVDDEEDTGDEPSGNKTVVPVSVSPRASATNVAVSSDITLSYGSPLYDDTGKRVTVGYVEDCIELRRGSSTGAKVPYEAYLSSSSEIVIEADSRFDNNTTYYTVIPEGSFYDEDGNTNPRSVYSFTTVAQESQTVTFNPVSATKNVDPAKNLTISFSGAVRRSDGTTLNTNYLSGTAVELRENSLNGTKVDITATINSNSRTITVNPDADLKPATTYYLVIPSGTLEYTDGTHLARYYTYFTTSDKLAVTVTPASGTTNVSPQEEITLEFNSEIYRPSGSNVTASYLMEQVIELRQNSTAGTKIDFTAVLSSDRKTVTIIPSQLSSGARYYVIIPAGKLANDNGTELAYTTSYFTTASEMTPAITPANGKTDVSPSSEIKIEFTDELYDRSKNRITPEYIENSVVVLRKNSASGTIIPYEAQISSDYKTINIVPDTPLAANQTYYVYVTGYTLYNENNRANTAAYSTFKTSYTNAPDFLPYNGEKDVEVNSNIEITFDKKMYTSGGGDITASYVKQKVVELYKDSYDGEALNFSVSLSTDKQTFIINPTYDFDGETTYVVVITKGSLEDEDGNENEFYSSSFTTTEKVSTLYTVTPETRATNVSLTTPVAVTFESAVYRTNGTIATGAYIINNDIIELRKGSTGGEEVECEVTVSEDNKTITLVPKTKLTPKYTYYVRVNSGKLVYSNGASIVSKVSYFTTSDGNPVVDKFESVSAGASHVTVGVTANMDAQAYVTLSDSNGTKVTAPATDVKAGEVAEITVTGLASNTSYTASVYITNADGLSSVAKAIGVSTKDPFEIKLGEVTENTAAVVVSAFCEGEIEITYKNLKTGVSTSRVSGLVMKADAERTFTISGLDTKTEYQVTAVFTDNFGVSKSLSKKFTTAEPKEEVLELLSITLTDSNGDTYNAEIKNGVAEVTTENAEYVNLVAESSVKNSEVTYNAAAAVAPGAKSQNITVVAGETTEIAVVLTSKDNGNTVNCTVKVTVHE